MINGKAGEVIEKLLNPINKKDNKCFQYDATVPLNCEEIRSHPEITKKKNLYFKLNLTVTFTVLYANTEKYIFLMVQSITHIMKNKLFIRWHYLAVKIIKRKTVKTPR